MNGSDPKTLAKLKKFFKCGQITTPTNKSETPQYKVENIKHLKTIIIPFFDKYTLKTWKYNSQVYQKKALDLHSIWKTSGTSMTKTNLESYIISTEYKSYDIRGLNHCINNPLEALWVVGFVDGDGSFNVSRRKASTKSKPSIFFKPVPEFSLSQSSSSNEHVLLS